jgi:hypothetical protein
VTMSAADVANPTPTKRRRKPKPPPAQVMESCWKQMMVEVETSLGLLEDDPAHCRPFLEGARRRLAERGQEYLPAEPRAVEQGADDPFAIPDFCDRRNPIAAAWDNASDEQRREFVELRRAAIAGVGLAVPDSIEWPEPDGGDEDEDPLFDSTRGYVEQIDRFKEYQQKPTERQSRKNGGGS